MAISENAEAAQESVGRRATRTFFASVVGKVAGLIITTLTFIAVARLLNPSGYGIYTVAVGYAGLIGAVSIFGIASYFDRNVSYLSYRRDGKGIGKVLANGYAIVVPISIVLMLVGIGFSGYITQNFLANSGIQVITLMIVSVDLLFSTIWGASYAALIGFGKGKQAAFALFSLGAIQLITGVGLIYAGFYHLVPAIFGGVNGAVIGLLVGDCYGFLLTTYYTYATYRTYHDEPIRLPKPKEIYKTLQFTLPLAANNFLYAGTANFGVLFLSMFALPAVVGNYGTAIKGLGMMNVIYGTLAFVLVQAFSTFLSMKNKKKEIALSYNNALRYSLLLNLPIVVFVGVFAKPLVYVFLGPSFSLAPTYLFFIALGTSIGVINSLNSSFLIASGKVKQLMKISAVAVVIQLAGILLLVPTFTAVGAIVALYIIGNLSSLALYIKNLRKNFGIRVNYRTILNLFVTNLVLAMFVSTILTLAGNITQMMTGLVAMVLIYPPLLVVFKGIDTKTLDELVHLVHTMPVMRQAIGQFDSYTRFFMGILDKEA
ncbi:MAG: polysaccharide biosynthesis protein [Candidatus Micrarchaeota archaeon]|nr:polysaccharide biosynthesis protein [Candidatus Micrarchaeota archaeon]